MLTRSTFLQFGIPALLVALLSARSADAQAGGAPLPLPNQPVPGLPGIPGTPFPSPSIPNQQPGTPATQPNLNQKGQVQSKNRIERDFKAFPGKKVNQSGNPRTHTDVTQPSQRSRRAGGPFPLPLGPRGPMPYPGRNQNAKKKSLRFQLKTKMRVRGPSPSSIALRFQRRLTKLPRVSKYKSIIVALNGRTATLRGVVDSEADRDLIRRLALLETGISAVNNQLQIRK